MHMEKVQPAVVQHVFVFLFLSNSFALRIEKHRDLIGSHICFLNNAATLLNSAASYRD